MSLMLAQVSQEQPSWLPTAAVLLISAGITLTQIRWPHSCEAHRLGFFGIALLVTTGFVAALVALPACFFLVAELQIGHLALL